MKHVHCLFVIARLFQKSCANLLLMVVFFKPVVQLMCWITKILRLCFMSYLRMCFLRCRMGGGLMWCVLHRVSPIFLTVVWGGGVHVHVVIWHLYGLIHIPFYLVCLLVHYHQC